MNVRRLANAATQMFCAFAARAGPRRPQAAEPPGVDRRDRQAVGRGRSAGRRPRGAQAAAGLWLLRRPGPVGRGADLFADDGTVEIGMDGVYVGKARIREYLQRPAAASTGLAYGQLNEHAAAAAQGRRRRGRPDRQGPLARPGHDSATSARTPTGATGSRRTPTSRKAGSGRSRPCTSTSISSPRTPGAGRG